MSWEWSDIRYFLAVARTGSTAAAARQLGMNQTTCARRITALEHALGVELFERLPSGYVLTEPARRLIAAAEAMEQAARTFEEGASGIRRETGKVIRLTAIDAVVDAVVMPAVAKFQARHRDTRVEIDLSQRLLDLSRGEADVALRASKDPPADPGLVAWRLATLRLSAYCGADYAARATLPTSIQELASHPVVALEGRFEAWLRDEGLGSSIVQVLGSLAAVVTALRIGAGVALLPGIVADAQPGLVRCFDLPEQAVGLWLIYHERLRSRPEIRDFSRFLAEQVDTLKRPTDAVGEALTGLGT